VNSDRAIHKYNMAVGLYTTKLNLYYKTLKRIFTFKSLFSLQSDIVITGVLGSNGILLFPLDYIVDRQINYKQLNTVNNKHDNLITNYITTNT